MVAAARGRHVWGLGVGGALKGAEDEEADEEAQRARLFDLELAGVEERADHAALVRVQRGVAPRPVLRCARGAEADTPAILAGCCPAKQGGARTVTQRMYGTSWKRCPWAAARRVSVRVGRDVVGTEHAEQCDARNESESASAVGNASKTLSKEPAISPLLEVQNGVSGRNSGGSRHEIRTQLNTTAQAVVTLQNYRRVVCTCSPAAIGRAAT